LAVENNGSTAGVGFLWSNGDTTSSTTAYNPGWMW